MRERYGRGPLHLLGHLVALGVISWALLEALDQRRWAYFVIWMLGAIALHDALLWPLYSLLDRGARRVLPRAAINYVRVPVGLWLVLGLVYLPVILERGEGNFRRVAGIGWDGHLARWLIAGAVLALASAVLYGIRRAAPSSRPVT